MPSARMMWYRVPNVCPALSGPLPTAGPPPMPGACVSASPGSADGSVVNPPVAISGGNVVGASCALKSGGGVRTPAATAGAVELLQATHRVAPGARSTPHLGHRILGKTHYRTFAHKPAQHS